MDIDDIKPEHIAIFLIALFVMAVFCCILAFVQKAQRDAKNAAQPVMKRNARVLEKQQLQPGQIPPYFEIWILFELENGVRLRLYVKMDNSLMVGDQGLLTWQGDKLLAFQRYIQEPRMQADNVLRIRGKYCAACGQLVNEGDAFCGKCGHRV